MPDAFPDRGAVRFRKHRDVGDVINATVAVIRGNARELLMSYVAIVAPVALASGIAIGLYFYQMGDLLADPEALESDPFAMFGLPYLGILAFGVLGGALTLASAAGYVRLYREGRAGEITAGMLWEEARGLILPFIGLSLVYGLVLILSAVIAVIPCLGILAWMGLALWLLPYVSVTIAVRTLEEPTLGAAWRRARDLVKGSWGFSFLAILLAMLVFYVVLLIVSIPLYVVMVVVMINSVQTDPTAVFATMGGVMAPLQVVSYAAYLIPLLAIFFVHGRLVEELDGTGLYEDLDSLAGLNDPAADLAGFDAPSASRPAPSPDPRPSSTPPASGPPDAAADDTPEDDDASPGGFRGGGFRA